jgi:hypothetical protein
LSYARILLTPYNENLVLSSSTGAGGLADGFAGSNQRATAYSHFPQSISTSASSKKREVSLRFRRIFLEVYPRRLRLQHDSEYPAEFSNSIPEGQDRRSHGARDACRRAWAQRNGRLRSHALPLVQPRSRRNQFRRGLCPGGAPRATISPFSRLRTSIISSSRGGWEVSGWDSPGDSTAGWWS